MGVKQGAAMSGMLFVIYIDRMLRMIRSRFNGFLKDVHALLLMDDTILFATSRVRGYCRNSRLCVSVSSATPMVW